MLLLHACNSNSYVHKVSQDSLVWKWLNPISKWLTKLEMYWPMCMKSPTVNSFRYKWTQGSFIGNLPFCLSFLCSGFTAKKKFLSMSFPKDPGKPHKLLNWLCVGPFLSQSMKKGVQYPDWSGHVSAPFSELMCGASPPWTTQTDSEGRVVFQRRIRALFSIGEDWVLHKQGEKFTCLTLSHLFYRMEL